MTEILNKLVVSNMQSLVVQQATETGMIVNDRRTKEMLISLRICMPILAFEPNCCAKTLESLQQRAMKIIFPDKD